MATEAQDAPDVDAAAARKAANRFDIRRIIGGLFVLYGVILTVVGIVGSEAIKNEGGRDQRQPLDRPRHARRRRADGHVGADAPGGAARGALTARDASGVRGRAAERQPSRRKRRLAFVAALNAWSIARSAAESRRGSSPISRANVAPS